MKSNFKNTKLNTNHGITLVALIITIIVLLILAMVSIRLVMNGGIIKIAESETNDYSNAQIETQLKLVYAEDKVGESMGFQNVQNIQKRLEQIFGEGNVSNISTVNRRMRATIKINGEEKNYLYDERTGEAKEIFPKELSALTKNNYGDYIDLGQNVVGTNATTDDWRILYNDKNGHLYAILADYLPNNNSAVKASGLHIISNRINNVNSTISRQDLLDKISNTTAWQSLIPIWLRNSCQVKGATTVDIIMESYNEKYGTNLDYAINTVFYIDGDSSKEIDSLYAPHPENEVYNNCYGYWLTSLYTEDEKALWYMRYKGVLGYYYYNYSSLGVCPVVSLPSNIQVVSSTLNGKTIWTVIQ